MVDSEIKCLLDDSYKRAMNILVTHKNELHLLAGKCMDIIIFLKLMKI